MSSRQLRRLKKTQIDDEIEIENDNEFSDDFSPDEKGQINMFSMLDTEEIEEPDSDIEDENHDNQHDAEKKYTTDTLSDNDSRNDARPNLDKQDTNIKTKKKNKKKRTSKNITKKETSEKEIKLEKEVFNPVEIEIKYIDPEREINFLFKMNKYVPSNKLISEKLVNLPYQNTGIGMEIINESQNVTWLAFTHSSHFRKLEARLLDQTQLLMPHLINHLAAENPFHTTTILQLYFISIQMGDITSGNVFRVDSLYSLASSYITRVLYTFEKEFIYQFKTLLLKNKTKYVCKLSYYRYENRPFFIAIWAWMGLIMRKGCWRTSLEMGKFLATFSPFPGVPTSNSVEYEQEGDPLGVWLILDYLALRCTEHQWIINTWNLMNDDSTYEFLKLIPGWHFSYALALFLTNQRDKKADDYLISAIHEFPNLVKVLVERIGFKISFEPGFNDVYFNRVSNESVCLLIDIYVERVYSFWKEPIVQAWLERIIPIAFETKTKSTIDKSLFHSTIPKSYYRHLYLTDIACPPGSGGAGSNSNPAAAPVPTPASGGTPININSYFSKWIQEQRSTKTPWNNDNMNALDPFPPLSVPKVSIEDGLSRMRLNKTTRPLSHNYSFPENVECSPVWPYCGYFRVRLLQMDPKQVSPFLIPEVKYVSSDNDKIKNELSVLVNHLKALDINFKELDTAIQEKLLSDFQRYYYHNEETNDVLNVIGSVANDFLNSLMPWSNNYSVAVNLDVHAIDGMISFLKGN